MKGKTVLIMLLFLGITFSNVFAEEPVVPTEQGVISVNNSDCLVSGEPVSGKHFAVVDGKQYGLCCKACVKKFNKNPERFLAKLKGKSCCG